VQVQLADGEPAFGESFLVVVDDAAGDVQERHLAGVVAAVERQVREGDAAEQAEAGRPQFDLGPDEGLAQLGHDVVAHDGRVGPVIVDPRGAHQAADPKDCQPAEEPSARHTVPHHRTTVRTAAYTPAGRGRSTRTAAGGRYRVRMRRVG